jgi:hypothetical protein
MALAHVKDSASVVVSSGNPSTANLTFTSTIAAGSTLVVVLSQAVVAARTYTVSDNIHGTDGWTKAIGVTSGATDQIWYRGNHSGGTVTITVTHGQSSPLFITAAAELSGYGSAVTVEATDSLTEGVGATSHTCSASGVSSSNECFAFCVGHFGSGATECNPGTGYTEITPGYAQGQFLFQRRHFSSGCTNEVGAWTNTGSARAGISVIALLSAGVAGGGGAATHNSLLLLGVG